MINRLKIDKIIKGQVLLLFLCIQISFSQNLKIKIDSIAKIHFIESTNSGLSIGIIKNGETNEFYYGGKYTNQIKDIDSATLFEIGSVTKLYTAFIFAVLEKEKKINRCDLLSKYLPESITKGKKWASRIKLIDLATHTSGLPSFDNTKSLIKLDGFDENNPYGVFTEDFMMSVLKDTDTLNNYGKIRYSNFGIGVLGLVLASSQKTTFKDLFKKYINQNQNLKSTFLSLSEKDLTNIAIPHRKLKVMPLIQLEKLSPSGSIKTTMSDLLKFLKLHIQPPNSIKNVVKTVLSNQLKEKGQKVGLAWGIYSIENEIVYFHNGGTYGSSSIVIIAPQKKVGVAILANNNSNGELTNYALKIIKKLIK